MLTLLIITLTLLQPAFGQTVTLKEFPEVDTGNEEVQKGIVHAHNECRRKVDPPASNMLEMGWDKDVAKHAADYASECTCIHSSLAYRTVNGTHYGENILLSDQCVLWTTTVDLWDDEKKYFDFGQTPPLNVTFAHYTQVVWFTSNTCGCAVAQCPNTKCPYFYVCWYRDVGNLQERPYKPYDKGPTCGQCKNKCKNKLCQNSCSLRNKATLEDCESLRRSKGCHRVPHGKMCDASCKCKRGTIYQ